MAVYTAAQGVGVPVVKMASSVAECCAVVGEMLLGQYIVSELINRSEVIKKKTETAQMVGERMD